MTKSTADISPALLFFVYALMLGGFLASSFFPESRLWGLSVWAYFPLWVRLTLCGLGLVVPLLVYFVHRPTDEATTEPDSNKRFWIYTVSLTAAFGVLFVLLRNRTHFLGDGYTVLTSLAKDNPLIKSREIGESLTHVWVKNLCGSGFDAAVLSFQIISIAAGILFLLLLAFIARQMFTQNHERWLFFFGVASGGFMLLFFGYVEYYSLFSLSILLYLLIGLKIAQRQLSKWWILPLQAWTILFHTLGAILLPATIYLLIEDTAFVKRFRHYRRKTKWMLAAGIVIVGAALFAYLHSTYLFFRFAFLTVVPGRFTIEGYSLFSAAHLVDYLNLLLMLIPGLPILIVVLMKLPWRSITKYQDNRFLIVASLSTLGTIFVLDPKLGMPRDWDLFSFAFLPLALLVFLIVIRLPNESNRPLTTAMLLTLGFLILGSRVAELVLPPAAEARFLTYTNLDRVKNRNARIIYKGYLVDDNRKEEAERISAEWKSRFPEEHMAENARDLLHAGYYRQAADSLMMAIDLNPTYWNAWTMLGTAYQALRDNDSALICLRIADGLNPYNSGVYNNLAHIYAARNDYKRASYYWSAAIKRDSLFLPALTGLDRLEMVQRTAERPCHHLRSAASRPEATFYIIQALGDCYVSYHDYDKARQVYEIALQRGMDSTHLDEVEAKNPQFHRR